MTDYDFFQLGAPAASKTIDHEQNKQVQLPRIGKANGKADPNDIDRYEEDFESFEESLKKSKLLPKRGSKLGDHPNQNIRSANLKQTLAKGDSAVRQGRAFRTNSTRPANKSVAINRTSEAAQEDHTALSKYSTEVSQQFPDIDYDKLTDKQVVTEIERVRVTIKRYNEDLNDIMERNHDYLYKKEFGARNAKVGNTDDAIRTLEMMRESNSKTLQTCQNDVAKLQKRVTDIDGKDPVIKLSEEIALAKKAIDEHKKQLKQMSLAVDKAQKNIEQNVAAAEDDSLNYRKHNEIRNQLGYLTKKNEQFEKKEKQVDKAIKQAQVKDDDINVKFQTSKKLAEDKCLEVASNRTFVETKKRMQQLTEDEETAKRNIEVYRRRLKQLQQNHEKEATEAHKESGRLDEALAIKQSEVAVVLRQIKLEIGKATSAHEKGLKVILTKFARTDDEENLLNNIRAAAPPSKKNYIDTSSTLKNLEADRTVQDLQKKLEAKRNEERKPVSSPKLKTKDKQHTPDIFRPPINKRRDRSSNDLSVEEAPQERQWKLDEKDKPKQTPTFVKDVDFALNDKTEAAIASSVVKPEKMTFKFNKKKVEETADTHNIHNTSMPVISDLKRLDDKLEGKPQEPNTIQHRPKFFRPRARESNNETAGGYLPTTVKEVGGQSGQNSQMPSQVKEIFPSIVPEKKEQTNSKPIMMRIQRKSQAQGDNASFDTKPSMEPIANPVVKAEQPPADKVQATRPKLRSERPSKFKIEKQMPVVPKQKYDIFAAEQPLVEQTLKAVDKQQPRFTDHLQHNKQLTLQELLGNDRVDKSKEFDDILLPKSTTTKPIKPKQRDFFGDMDM